MDGYKSIYLNLAHRTDRRLQIEKELGKIGLQAERVEAVYEELNGVRGCVRSHIKALEIAIEKKWNSVLILEDDCLFQKNRIDAYIKKFLSHFQNSWDVLLLGGELQFFEKTAHPDYVRVQFSLRSHAYLVNGPYLPVLKEHFLATAASLQQDLFFTQSLEKALDRQWIALQWRDRWFMGVHPVARQSRSYSDIEKGVKTKR